MWKRILHFVVNRFITIVFVGPLLIMTPMAVLPFVNRINEAAAISGFRSKAFEGQPPASVRDMDAG